jgi:pyruvate dehydrogenase E2 component (dihydrolipoamide acetyltransferase)
METGRIVEWLKSEGDRVEQGDPLCVVETDKSVEDIKAPDSGFLRRVLVPVGQDTPPGSVLAIISDADEVLGEEEVPSTTGESLTGATAEVARPHQAQVPSRGLLTSPIAGARPVAESKESRPVRQPSSPAARRLAGEIGVDIAAVTGTGEGDIVTEADVRAHASATSRMAVFADQNVTVVPLVGVRRRIAERMALSRRTVADVTTVVDVDMMGVAALRVRTGLSYTAYVAWAICQVLLEFPSLNASFADDRILVRADIHLGVAVALSDGLVVPVIRNANTKSVEEIATAIDQLAARARQSELRPEELTGSTFTLTNSGAFGSLFFTPIINLPEVAIIGIGRVAETPVVRRGAIEVGKVMYMCLSYDHRAVDGAAAVSFLAEVKRRLQDLGPEAEQA